MAKLKAQPKSYSEAAQYLAGRDSVKLGNNTWLEKLNGGQQIAVRLHGTYIVLFYNPEWYALGKITLYTGGYRTVTTKDRINQFITGRVYQKAHQWYLSTWGDGTKEKRTLEFSEGMEVQQ